jgi:hypothetical protein
MASSLGAGRDMPPWKIGPQQSFDGVFQFWTIKIGRVGCDLAFTLIGHRVNFGLRRFGIND